MLGHSRQEPDGINTKVCFTAAALDNPATYNMDPPNSLTTAAAAIVETYQQVLPAYYATVAAIALVGYDWLLYLDQEIHLIWQHPKTGASLLYICSRYLGILEQVFGNITINPLSDQSCTILTWIDQAILLLNLVYPALFSSLRVYALTECSKILLMVTLVLSLMPFIINLSTVYQIQVVNLPTPLGCSIETDVSQAYIIMFTLLSRVPLVLSDLIVIIVTWIKLYKIGRLVHHGMEGPTLHYTMLQGGTIYFIILLLLNTLQITLNLLSIQNQTVNAEYVTVLIDPLISILISHFILNLRQISAQPDLSTTPSFVAFTPPPFAGLVHSSSGAVTLQDHDDTVE